MVATQTKHLPKPKLFAHQMDTACVRLSKWAWIKPEEPDVGMIRSAAGHPHCSRELEMLLPIQCHHQPLRQPLHRRHHHQPWHSLHRRHRPWPHPRLRRPPLRMGRSHYTLRRQTTQATLLATHSVPITSLPKQTATSLVETAQRPRPTTTVAAGGATRAQNAASSLANSIQSPYATPILQLGSHCRQCREIV